jgi:small-conductance mechanosensitive channel/CRP-like cAMP-binding protein
MHDPLGQLERNDRFFEVAAFVVALLLILVLRAVLPADEKKKAGQPALFLLLAVVFGGVTALLDASARVGRLTGFLYAFFLFSSSARSAVLLLLDVLLARRTHKPTPTIFRDVVQAVTYFVVAIVTLHTVGVEPGSILTTSALLTAALGLALQDTLGNMVSGLALQMQRPFDVGDWVQFDGGGPTTIGKVTEVNWRATTLMTHDLVEVIVPNGLLAKTSLKNFSRPSKVARKNVTVTAGYDVAPERVHTVILAAIRDTPGVLEEPSASVVTRNFADSTIEYTVFYFIDDMQSYLPIEGRVRNRIFYGFQRAGIEFPYPVRTVHMHEVSDESKKRAEERELSKRDQALRCVDFLDVLPDAAHRKLASEVGVKMFAQGEIIVREGEKSSELYIIDKGEVFVEVQKERETVNVATLRAGSFFGEMSLMTGEERKATVRAASECTLLVVDHEAFHHTIAASPEIVERMSDILAKRQEELEEAVLSSPDRQSKPMVDRSRRLLSQIRGFFNL